MISLKTAFWIFGAALMLLSACSATKQPKFFSPQGYAAHLAATQKSAPQEMDETQFRKMLALAEQGDATAQYHIGMFYHNGIVADKNRELAFKWFQKSALNNNPLAAYKVGSYYGSLGKGFMDLDQTKALAYKRVAAEAGYNSAQYDLANILISQNNIDEGIKWLKASAHQGELRSLRALFDLYYRGNKVARDLPAAYRYLKLAMKVARDEAPAEIQKSLLELTKTVTQTERDEADQFVASWQPQPTALTIEAERGLQSAKDYLK